MRKLGDWDSWLWARKVVMGHVCPNGVETGNLGRNSEIWADAKRDGEMAWHRSHGCPTTVPVPMGTFLRGNLGSWAIPIVLTVIHQTCLDLPLLQLLVEFYSYINYLKSEKKKGIRRANPIFYICGKRGPQPLRPLSRPPSDTPGSQS